MSKTSLATCKPARLSVDRGGAGRHACSAPSDLLHDAHRAKPQGAGQVGQGVAECPTDDPPGISWKLPRQDLCTPCCCRHGVYGTCTGMDLTRRLKNIQGWGRPAPCCCLRTLTITELGRSVGTSTVSTLSDRSGCRRRACMVAEVPVMPLISKPRSGGHPRPGFPRIPRRAWPWPHHGLIMESMLSSSTNCNTCGTKAQAMQALKHCCGAWGAQKRRQWGRAFAAASSDSSGQVMPLMGTAKQAEEKWSVLYPSRLRS